MMHLPRKFGSIFSFWILWLMLPILSSSLSDSVQTSRRGLSTAAAVTTPLARRDRGGDVSHRTPNSQRRPSSNAIRPCFSTCLLAVRGGASSSASAAADSSATQPQRPPWALSSKLQQFRPTLTNVSQSVVVVALLTFVYRYRNILLNKEYIQDETLKILEKLKPKSDSTWDVFHSLALYAAGMACWELLGLSTIPVETAAGMVFGWNAVLASFVGKLVGAVVAFGLGRTIMADWARHKLATNPLFALLDSSNVHSPWMTALLMKYSCFPEFIKNFGSSLLQTLTLPMFVLATTVHGGYFSALWTFWGVETAAKLRDADHIVDGWLQTGLIVAGINTVASPIIMAWWIRDLRKHAQTNKNTKS